MNYGTMIQGKFLARPNRFLADVRIKKEQGEDEICRCHVKNTGRLREILMPGVTVWIERNNDPKRKTKYSLISAIGPSGDVVNLDSQAPNAAAAEWVSNGGDGNFSSLMQLKREQKFGDSRFDLYFEANGKRCFMEVKGVTLNVNGIARFPDAPTERGLKHLQELVKAKEAGYEAYLLFVIAMKGIHAFGPNEKTHPEFADALRNAAGAGVHILAYDCEITPGTMTVDRQIPVLL